MDDCVVSGWMIENVRGGSVLSAIVISSTAELGHMKGLVPVSGDSVLYSRGGAESSIGCVMDMEVENGEESTIGDTGVCHKTRCFSCRE